jgi:hypothetical protein
MLVQNKIIDATENNDLARDKSKIEPLSSLTTKNDNKKVPLSSSNKIPLGPILSPSLAVLASTAEDNDMSMTGEEHDVSVSTEASDESVSAEANDVSVSAEANDFFCYSFFEQQKIRHRQK